MLLTATLESYLAGHLDAALPGMLVSLALARPRSPVPVLPPEPGCESNRDVAQRDQLTGLVTGVCAPALQVLGLASVAAQLLGPQLRHDYGRDDSRIHLPIDNS